ncbi:hypothetical protein ACHWQZ_G012907 [Mnemiopsis leidyi]
MAGTTVDLDLFTQSLTENGEDVFLETYILAYEEISKIFGVLGTVFKFVSTDVNKKINILRSKLRQDPDSYRTVRNMVMFETCHNVTVTDTNNGCRTLLRLHRALEFVAEFIQVLSVEKGDNISNSVWTAYSATLAKHHTWLVRNSVSMAMYTLPTRGNILEQVGKTERPESLGNLVSVMRDVYRVVETAYTEFDLLQLK